MKEEIEIDNPDLEIRYIQTNEFYRIGKELFQFERNKEDTYSQKKKNCLNYYSLGVPDELNNYFIRLEDAAIFFSFESKFLLYIEEFIKFKSPQKAYCDNYHLIKDFYNKWNQVKYPEEKKYFASSILNYYEKDPNRNNFLSAIKAGIVLCFDANVRNVPEGIYLFEKASQIIESSKINEVYKKELKCLIDIYSGFGKMFIMKYEEAKDFFDKAILINPISITAKYYLAYCENKLIYYNISENLINEIFEYDVYRLNYSVEINNSKLFNYFLNNSLFKNIFYEEIFADNLSSIMILIQVQSYGYKVQPIDLLLLLNDLKIVDLKSFNSESMKKDIANIEEMLKPNIDSRNILFLKLFPTVINKIHSIVELIIESINSYYLKDIKENLSPLEMEIQEKLNFISNLGAELEEKKKQSKTKLEESIKNEERESIDNIKSIENKIEILANDGKYNPMSAFKNTMVYTIIISLVSSLLGGCAGYSNMYIKSSGELNSILSTIIINGFKWGIFAFLIGFLISVFSASVSIVKRTNKRQKLQASIKFLKDRSEIEKQRLQERFQAKEKSLSDNINDKISDLKKRIDEIKQNKDSFEARLKTEADIKINEETEPFKIIIEKIG